MMATHMIHKSVSPSFRRFSGKPALGCFSLTFLLIRFIGAESVRANTKYPIFLRQYLRRRAPFHPPFRNCILHPTFSKSFQSQTHVSRQAHRSRRVWKTSTLICANWRHHEPTIHTLASSLNVQTLMPLISITIMRTFRPLFWAKTPAPLHRKHLPRPWPFSFHNLTHPRMLSFQEPFLLLVPVYSITMSMRPICTRSSSARRLPIFPRDCPSFYVGKACSKKSLLPKRRLQSRKDILEIVFLGFLLI